MTLVLELCNNSSVTLLSCYVSTMNTPVPEIDIYDQLCSAILRLPDRQTCLYGRFNARFDAGHHI